MTKLSSSSSDDIVVTKISHGIDVKMTTKIFTVRKFVRIGYKFVHKVRFVRIAAQLAHKIEAGEGTVVIAHKSTRLLQQLVFIATLEMCSNCKQINFH